MERHIRNAAVAGTWYPGDPGDLRGDILKYLDQAVIPDRIKRPAAIISPHAGYIYSGATAAYAYKTIMKHSYDTVVVISPSHRALFPFCALWGNGAFETPLGQILVDEALCTRLADAAECIRFDNRPHLSEHALEMQLPFLQATLSGFSLVPVIMGTQDRWACSALCNALEKTIEDPERVLVVASSDLSHFHNLEQARAMDTKLSQMVAGFDIDGLEHAIEQGGVEACGGGPVMTAMQYARSRSKTDIDVLKYATSADVTNDSSSVVGYLAAVIH